MAKLNGLFEKYLSNIEPPSKAKEYAQEAHTRIRKHLETDPKFKDSVLDTFLYGSYKRQTSVGDIKDVDIIVLTNFDTSVKPEDALRLLKSSLNRFYKDTENLEYQTRSIKVVDPLPEINSTLTLDVIPAIPLGGEDDPVLVPDREKKAWIKSHPKGHLARTSQLNSFYHSKERYVPLVKIVKAWWKYQSKIKQPTNKKPRPKGFWLECLTSENFDHSKKQWADHFITVLGNISNKYPVNSEVPRLNDPGMLGEKIATGMNKEEFNFFLQTVNESLELGIKAINEEDEYRSSEMWKLIFGQNFPLAAKQEEYSIVSRASMSLIQLQDYSHKQELSDVGIETVTSPYQVSIEAELYFGTHSSKEMNRTYKGDVKSSSEIPPHHWIKYTATGPNLYENNIFWQVVNTGAHALKEGGLRGQIFPGNTERWEQSLYTGMHWVECFVVDHNGTCIGRSGPFYVIFRNPSFPYHILE